VVIRSGITYQAYWVHTSWLCRKCQHLLPYLLYWTIEHLLHLSRGHWIRSVDLLTLWSLLVDIHLVGIWTKYNDQPLPFLECSQRSPDDYVSYSAGTKRAPYGNASTRQLYGSINSQYCIDWILKLLNQISKSASSSFSSNITTSSLLLGDSQTQRPAWPILECTIVNDYA